jgi:dehydrogenase/reductase SDR family member 7B
MHFSNKVIWITGASSGIGAELAVQLAKDNTKLILTSRNEVALQKLASICRSSGSDCAVLTADLLSAEETTGLTQRAGAIFGRIDIVIFSAGQTQRSLAGDTNMMVYRQLMELNFFAPVALTNDLLPLFKAQGAGHIVAISSMAGLMGFPMRTGYAAAKHALKGFFETLQTEHNISGLHITIVSPGRINTPISKNAITGNGGTHGRMDDGQLNGIPVAACASRILQAVRRKKRHIIIAKSERLLWWLWWFVRPLYYKIARARGRDS